MTAPARLDNLLRLREQEEQQAEEALANAIRGVARAQAVLDAAVAAVRQAYADMTSSDLLTVQELALTRAKKAIAQANEQLAEAKRAEETARTEHLAAHRRTEALRRLTETRHEEARIESSQRERRALDEIGLLLFDRRQRST